MRAGIHAADPEAGRSFRCSCTSAENNIGVARLMDFIAKYGSSPVDRQKVKAMDANGKRSGGGADRSDPVLYVFKTMSEAQFGELSFFRIYSGSVKCRSRTVQHRPADHREDRPDLHAQWQDRTSVTELGAGDIGAVVKLKDTHTGNTLCGRANASGRCPRWIIPSRTFMPRSRASQRRGRQNRRPVWRRCTRRTRPFFTMSIRNCTRPSSPAQGELHLEVHRGPAAHGASTFTSN